MQTTTVRVDRETHARFVEISKASGQSLVATMRDAAEALHRVRFGQAVQREYALLREHPSEWADYLIEASASEVADGIS